MIVSWVDFHGRSSELARQLGMQAVFIHTSSKGKSLARQYWESARQTLKVLRNRDPDVVIVMLPPAPALVTTLLCKGKGAHLVADLHTGFFSDPKWSWFTKVGLWLLRNSAVMVTNRELAEVCEGSGVKTFVVHDPIVPTELEIADEDYLLCPLSYANDEPIAEILDAARKTPDQKFLFTGCAPQSIESSAPDNVKFSGFVDASEFDRLVRMSTAVVALTNRDRTMQRAGYEALMAKKPQITSDFRVLREFLEDAAVYANPNDAESIAQQIRKVVDNLATYEVATDKILRARVADQRISLDAVSSYIECMSAKRGAPTSSEAGSISSEGADRV